MKSLVLITNKISNFKNIRNVFKTVDWNTTLRNSVKEIRLKSILIYIY